MFGRGWLGHERGRHRMFERGDLKYIILQLLLEKPRHGYEIIRALEERSGGFYSPSPGAVYPTLQMLEDIGHVTVAEQDGKKVYTITDDGRRFLTDRGPVMDDIQDRMRGFGGPDARREWKEMGEEMRELGRMFKDQARGSWGDPEKVRRIRNVVARARREISEILNEREPVGPPHGPGADRPRRPDGDEPGPERF